ncbi:MAG: hypothetical protein M3362_09770, partial [Acidobacteriota bacterium]|nr:hypothetical protein [Acidobacteriota bacterium]
MSSGVFYQINRTRRPRNRHLTLFFYLTALLFFGHAQTALAQGGPPLLTDDPGTPGNKHWEINIATTIERNRDGMEQETPILDVNYGLGKRLQLKWEVPYLRVRDQDEPAKMGLGSTNVGVKWRFFEDEKKGVSVSTYPQLEFNTSSSSASRG